MVYNLRERENHVTDSGGATASTLDRMQLLPQDSESLDGRILLQDVLLSGPESDLNELNRALESLDETLRQYVTDLVTQNKKLACFAHTVAHNLKGPIYNIAGYSSFLRDVWMTLPDERLQNCLAMIHRQAHRMSAILDEMLLLADLQQGIVDPSEPGGGRNGALRSENVAES